MKTIVVFCLIVIFKCLSSGATEQGTKEMSIVPAFETISPKDVESSVFKIMAGYKDLINALMTQLNSGALSMHAKAHVIYLLGELRANEAVPLLVQNIDYDVEPIMKYTRIQLHGRYPAKWALINIGMPSVRGILEIVVGEKKQGREDAMLEVVFCVLGAKTGYNYIDEELSKGHISKVKKQLILDRYRKVNSFNE